MFESCRLVRGAEGEDSTEAENGGGAHERSMIVGDM